MAATDSVSYDQFFDAFEEFSFPKNESSGNLMMGQYSPKPSKRFQDSKEKGLFGEFFQAVEQASFPLMPSSDSLVSLSSRPSMGSSSNFASQENFDETVFQFVQNLIVTNSHSHVHLNQLHDQHDMNNSALELPAIVEQLLDAYNDFMHNPNEEEY